MKDVAAILLAAGRSRRMGAFKPLLPFGDKTVIETCIDALLGAGISDLVVVIGHRGNDIRAQLKHRDVKFAVNTDSESEMGVSIARGVEQISAGAKALVIALVDHPAVTIDTFRRIINQWQAGARLVQPEHQGRGGHPVLIDLSYREELLKLNEDGGLRSFFDRHRSDVTRLALSSPFVARDMDTWEDYRKLHEDLFGQPPQI